MYKIVITNLPSFYKINLYNEINKRCRLLVIYTGDRPNGRNSDFFDAEMHFEHIFLRKNSIMRLFQLICILWRTPYSELILGGWDSLPLWVGAVFSRRRKCAVVVESSYIESTTKGIKGFVKRLFVKHVSKVYASGKAQRTITDNLGFKGTTIITRGVGIFNYIEQPGYEPRSKVAKFLYVGRLTAVKNLQFLIERFNNHPELHLTIVGFGDQEEQLRSIADSNIEFAGAVANKELWRYYQQADVLILPSISEAWGLVVEEALNNGTPVMVSDRVGCAEEIITPQNGVIFSLDSDSFERELKHICNIDHYNNLRKNISQMDFGAIARYQTECYI